MLHYLLFEITQFWTQIGRYPDNVHCGCCVSQKFDDLNDMRTITAVAWLVGFLERNPIQWFWFNIIFFCWRILLNANPHRIVIHEHDYIRRMRSSVETMLILLSLCDFQMHINIIPDDTQMKSKDCRRKKKTEEFCHNRHGSGENGSVHYKHTRYPIMVDLDLTAI